MKKTMSFKKSFVYLPVLALALMVVSAPAVMAGSGHDFRNERKVEIKVDRDRDFGDLDRDRKFEVKVERKVDRNGGLFGDLRREFKQEVKVDRDFDVDDFRVNRFISRDGMIHGLNVNDLDRLHRLSSGGDFERKFEFKIDRDDDHDFDRRFDFHD